MPRAARSSCEVVAGRISGRSSTRRRPSWRRVRNGLVYGRNIYQHPDMGRVTAALLAIIHDGASGTDAWDLYRSASSRTSERVTQADLLADVHDTIGESPVWLDAAEALYWVDAELHLVHRRTLLDEQVDTVSLSVPITALIPRSGGGWILVTKDGLFSASEDFTTLALVVDPARHEPGTRLNDGVADRWGRVWTGSMSRATVEDPVGRLYIVGPGKSVTEVDGGFAVANGIAMSPDGSRAYVSDMFHAQIRVYGARSQVWRGRRQAALHRDPRPRLPGRPGRRSRWCALGRLLGRRQGRSPRCFGTCHGPGDAARGPGHALLPGRPQRIAALRDHGALRAGRAQLRRQPHAGALFTAHVEGVGDPPATARL